MIPFGSAPRLRIAGDNPFVHAAVECGHTATDEQAAELVFDPTHPVRPGQIAAGFDRDLASLEDLRDNLAFVLIPLPDGSYGVQASDQLAYTIVELLAAEIGVAIVPLTTSSYERLMLALSFVGFAGVLRQEARDYLFEVFGNEQVVNDLLAQDYPRPPLPVSQVQRALDSLESPGEKRDFVSLVAHSAAYFDQRDVELWAATVIPSGFDS